MDGWVGYLGLWVSHALELVEEEVSGVHQVEVDAQPV